MSNKKKPDWDGLMDGAQVAVKRCVTCANVPAAEAAREALNVMAARRGRGAAVPPVSWLWRLLQTEYGLTATESPFRGHLRRCEAERYGKAYGRKA